MNGFGSCLKDTFAVVAHVSNTFLHLPFIDFENTSSLLPFTGVQARRCCYWPWNIISKVQVPFFLFSFLPLVEGLHMTNVYFGLFVDFSTHPWICYFSSEVMWIGCSWSTELYHCSYLLFLSDSAEKGSFFWFLNLQYLTKKGLFSLTLITNSCFADKGLLSTCHISS